MSARLAIVAAAIALPLSFVGPQVAALAQEAEAETASVGETERFPAETSWGEFEMLLRQVYAYIERDDIDVDAQLARSKALALQTENVDDFRRVLHQTALTFMDPHLVAGPFTDDDYSIVMTAADLDVAFEDGRAIVRDVRRGSPAFEAGIRPGDELVTINGNPAADAAVLPYGAVLPEPTAAQLDYGVMLAANGRRGHGRVITVRKADGALRQVELISATTYARSFVDRPPVTTEFVGPNGDVAVLRVQNSLGDNDTITAFDEAMKKVASARALVLDMRDTPSGGNTEVGRSIIGHFVSEVKPYQMHRMPVVERQFTVPREFVENVYPRGPRFDGPVFVLHGRWTGSMGEGIVIGMDSASDAVTIGSNMGDLLGALWNRTLPTSGVRVDLAGEALFHIDGTPREDYEAQIPISPAETAPDGSDPAIAAVLTALDSEN